MTEDRKEEKTLPIPPTGPPGRIVGGRSEEDPWPVEEMLRMLREVAADAMAHTVMPVYDKNGAETGVKYEAGAATAAMKAVETANRLRGGSEDTVAGVTVELGEDVRELSE